MSNITVSGLYSLAGLAKLIDGEGLKLSDRSNRMVMCDIVSKIGVTIGQKIAHKRKHVMFRAFGQSAHLAKRAAQITSVHRAAC